MSSKITRESVSSFLENKSFKKDNTVVKHEQGNTIMLLYNKEIARLSPNRVLEIRTAGWETKTTKDRLNALPRVHLLTKKGKLYLNGKIWENSCNWITIGVI